MSRWRIRIRRASGAWAYVHVVAGSPAEAREIAALHGGEVAGIAEPMI